MVAIFFNSCEFAIIIIIIANSQLLANVGKARKYICNRQMNPQYAQVDNFYKCSIYIYKCREPDNEYLLALISY